ncbi:MAG TPA: anion permease [Candidatus Binatia bacterium]|jgi:L-tartrate/succinate antiporter
MGNYWKALLPIVLGVGLFLLPVPEGLKPNAWYYFALFAAVILALILEPIPAAAVGLVGVTAATVSLWVAEKPADSIKWALSGFQDGTVWLIFVAFMFALGYEKTGLGRRVALNLVKRLGKRTLGLGYAVALADLALAPFTPSNTARSGGTIFPVIKNIPPLYGSEPGPTSRKIGAYIMWTAFATTCLTSSMFLTGLAPNLLALSLVKQTAKIDITWIEWFMGILPVGAVLFILLPYIIYKVYPPEVKSSPDVPVWAAEELKKMGHITMKEIGMGALAILALGLWIFGGDMINATTVALVVLSLMVIMQIVAWDDVLANKQAWNVLVWFATLVTLADGLNKVGFLKWFAGGAATAMGGYSVMAIVIMLTVVYFVVHYMFASLTAHTTALLPVLLTAAIAVPDMPVKLISLLFCYTLGLMGIISPYATGPGPIYYGSGYVTRKEFWTLGLVFGALYLAVLLVIGVPYLRMYLG